MLWIYKDVQNIYNLKASSFVFLKKKLYKIHRNWFILLLDPRVQAQLWQYLQVLATLRTWCNLPKNLPVPCTCTRVLSLLNSLEARNSKMSIGTDFYYFLRPTLDRFILSISPFHIHFTSLLHNYIHFL